MNAVARFKPPKNSDSPCADLVTMAERELSAFFKAVAQMVGSEQAELSRSMVCPLQPVNGD